MIETENTAIVSSTDTAGKDQGCNYFHYQLIRKISENSVERQLKFPTAKFSSSTVCFIRLQNAKMFSLLTTKKNSKFLH